MSTFESSSSFVAPVAAPSASTRATGLRKTHNHNPLTISTAFPHHTKPLVEVDSDEEEERIRVALAPVLDERYSSLKGESDTAISFTIQFGWIGAIRNAFARAKKSFEAAEKGHHRVLSAFTIFALFFLVVMFGSSVAANAVGNDDIITPSGSSMRITPQVPVIPILPPRRKANYVRDDVPSSSRQPPSSMGRAARITFVTPPSVPPSELQGQAPLPILPSPRVEAADIIIPVNPPYGTMSAKFRLLYVRNQQPQQQPPQPARQHPDDLAILFNGGHLDRSPRS